MDHDVSLAAVTLALEALVLPCSMTHGKNR